MINYGEMLKNEFTRAGYNQNSIAKKIKMSPQNLGTYLKKTHPPLILIEKICNALNIEVYEFFADDETRQKIKIINSPLDDFDKNVLYTLKAKLTDEERRNLFKLIDGFIGMLISRTPGS